MDPKEKWLLSVFWNRASGFWRTPKAWILLTILVGTLLLQLLVQYRVDFWNRDFFDAIARRSETGIREQAINILPLAAASLALALASVWGRMTTKREWREWLSKRLYDLWLQKKHVHQLQFMPGEHQTPEYRIAEDGKVATDIPIDLVLGLLWAVLSAVTFIGVLWTVGGDIDISLSGHPLTIPKYLVIAVILYSMIVTGAMLAISRRMTDVMGEAKRTEAELRSIGSHLRASGEVSANPAGDWDGRRIIGKALDQVIAKSRAYCWQYIRMTSVAHTNFIATPIIALLLSMPKYIGGGMTLGEVVQVAAAFVFVQSAFNWVTDSYSNIAEWASSARRVSTLMIALDHIDEKEKDLAFKMEDASQSLNGQMETKSRD